MKTARAGGSKPIHGRQCSFISVSERGYGAKAREQASRQAWSDQGQRSDGCLLTFRHTGRLALRACI